jgi:hypothetical protein
MVIGLTLAVITGAVLEHLDAGTLLRHPKNIGDIKIIPFGPKTAPNNAPDGGFTMTKDGERFFYAAIGSNDKITDVAILRGKDIFFTMATSKRSGNWIGTTYGFCHNGRDVGEHYMDLNFDGQFDLKGFYNDKGELISKYIYINQDWIKVDWEKPAEHAAGVGQTKFIFDPNSGWQESK